MFKISTEENIQNFITLVNLDIFYLYLAIIVPSVVGINKGLKFYGRVNKKILHQYIF